LLQKNWRTDWHKYLGPLMCAVRDTPQDSTGSTIFELLYSYQVCTPMTSLKWLWTGDNKDPKVKMPYQYVVDLRQRVEETCKLARNKLAKVQTRNQRYYNKKTREQKLNLRDSVLLLPTERNKLEVCMGTGAAGTPRDGDNVCGFTVGMESTTHRDTAVCVSKFAAALGHTLYGAYVLLKIVQTAVCTTNGHVSGPSLLPCWPYPRRQKTYAGCWLCRWTSVFTWSVGIDSIRP